MSEALGLRVDVDGDAIRYEIPGPGYGLPYHAHSTRDEYHDITALAGEVIVFGYGWHRVLKPGERMAQGDFDNGLPHAISSRGPAAWVNRYPLGAPARFLAMTEGERHTVLDSRVDLPDWLLAQL